MRPPLTPDSLMERKRRADIVKAMRLVMGARSKDIAKVINANQGNYSKMERGYESISDYRYGLIREAFIQWRDKEVLRLQKHIEYLNSLTDENQ